MNEDLNDIQYSPIRDFRFEEDFKTMRCDNKTLSDDERKRFVSFLDECICSYSEGLPLMGEELERIKDLHDEFHEMNRVFYSVSLFVLHTMIDYLIAIKYFILADKDYDRKYMRGKLSIILNEGFKRLYGFNSENKKKSEWQRLSSIMKYFPVIINIQYQRITLLLEMHSKKSSWWREERNIETHIDAEALYVSRKEEIIESKVVVESMDLFNSLLSVDKFLTNVNACIKNSLLEKYHRGEL